MNRKKQPVKHKVSQENRRQAQVLVPLDEQKLTDEGINMLRPIEEADLDKDGGDMRGVTKEVNKGRPAQ